MEVSSTHQMYVFVLCVLSGMACGLFFDIQRSLRKISSAGKMRTTAEDTVFVIVCSASAIAMGLIFNRGQIRYYQIMGLLSGALFYAAFLSHPVMKGIEIIYNVFVKIIVRPVVKILKTVIRPIAVLLSFCRRRITKMRRFAAVKKRSFTGRIKKIKKRMKML